MLNVSGERRWVGRMSVGVEGWANEVLGIGALLTERGGTCGTENSEVVL